MFSVKKKKKRKNIAIVLRATRVLWGESLAWCQKSVVERVHFKRTLLLAFSLLIIENFYIMIY